MISMTITATMIIMGTAILVLSSRLKAATLSASGSATEVAIVFEGVSELLLTEVSKSVGTKAVTTAVLDCAGVEVLPVDVAVVVAEPALRVGSLWDG